MAASYAMIKATNTTLQVSFVYGSEEKLGMRKISINACNHEKIKFIFPN